MTRFISVDRTGAPHAHQTAAEAAAAVAQHSGGWDWQLPLEEQAREALEAGKPWRQAFFPYAGNPVLLAAYPNPEGRPLRAFRNLHLEAAPESLAYLTDAAAAWSARCDIIRVGDVIRHPDGSESRVTSHMGDRVQAGGALDDGGFYLSRDGLVNYSGGLSAPIPLARLHPMGETRDAVFWFFLDGFRGAFRGVSCRLPCIVYKESDQ